jgi:hypothetical protein
MRIAYALFALGILTLYGASSLRGWELGGGRRGVIPASVRQSPGGYRSFTYWRGGK